MNVYLEELEDIGMFEVAGRIHVGIEVRIEEHLQFTK